MNGLQTGVPAGTSGLELLDEIFPAFRDVLPRIALGVVFLVVAFLGVKTALLFLRRVLVRVFPDEQDIMYRRTAYTIVSLFCWFGVALTFLSVVGLNELAAALGTATGFVALGVSYALKDIVADAVAGVYLLRDPDFNPGDEVTVDGFTGIVSHIELRKTRFEVDGDVVVRANGAIEGKWTKHRDDAPGKNAV